MYHPFTQNDGSMPDNRCGFQEAGTICSRLDRSTVHQLLPGDAVRRLTALGVGPDADPERDHGMADEILLAAVPYEVAAAYRALVKRSRWWAAA